MMIIIIYTDNKKIKKSVLVAKATSFLIINPHDIYFIELRQIIKKLILGFFSFEFFADPRITTTTTTF